MALQATNPLPFLDGLVGKWIVVKLNYGRDFYGKLMSTDSKMNLKLEWVKPFHGDEETGDNLKLMILCDNILYIREMNDEEREEIVLYWDSKNVKEKDIMGET
ncbi:hypothetical protein NPIL_471531 [Nephila pilipes]|uniref:Sm domain-containing protein n=1 Tax=Nephila pilipes TaxID=299642 RepID=A0A8X6TMY1_NEPPI|nr:hypothetical protein NPIL_471531 [Nephila pilipes]